MKKKNESRRAFLKGAAAGASAGAVAAFIPEANAQSGNNAEAATEPFSVAARHGAFFNHEQAVAIAAFVERLMPGAPDKPGATDADVLNYIDLALAGAYARLIEASGGGTLGLFTAIRRLRAVHARIADRPCYEKAITSLRAGATGRGPCRFTHGRKAVTARRSRRHPDRITPQQRHGVAVQRIVQPIQKGCVPCRIARQRIIEHTAHRPRALGREVRQIDRRQLPANVGRRVGGEIMNALDDRVAGEDKARVAHGQHSHVIE